MGDSKLLVKFRRLCEDYKAEYVIEGVVEDFDTIYPVPPERLTRGMTIRVGEETRFVDFHYAKTPPVEIGDKVMVVGKDHSLKQNGVLPVVILSPMEKWVLFSEEILLKRPNATELAIALGPAIFFLIGWLVFRGSNSLVASGMYLVGTFFLIAPSFLLTHLRRTRLYRCSEQEWHSLAEEIASRFGSKLGSLKQVRY